MLGYNSPEMIEGAMKNFEETVFPSHNIIKTLFSCGYPLGNRLRERELAAQHGYHNPDIPNEGVMGNWNRVIHEHFLMHQGDMLVTFDPDVRMQQKGWLDAMVESLNEQPDAMFCCAARPYHDEEWCIKQHGRTIHHTSRTGIRFAKYRELIAWSMGMWKAEFLITRPRNFAQANKYYGYSEHADYARLIEHKKTWISLVDFYDHHQGATDPQYTQWKLESAQGKTNKPFDVWLKGRR